MFVFIGTQAEHVLYLPITREELSYHAFDGITFIHKWCTYISETELGLAFVEKPVLEAEEKLRPGQTFMKLLRRRLLLKR